MRLADALLETVAVREIDHVPVGVAEVVPEDDMVKLSESDVVVDNVGLVVSESLRDKDKVTLADGDREAEGETVRLTELDNDDVTLVVMLLVFDTLDESVSADEADALRVPLRLTDEVVVLLAEAVILALSVREELSEGV